MATSARSVATRGRADETNGHRADPNLTVTRPTPRRHEQPDFRPDRIALWAVVLGVFLILIAVASAHAAVAHHVATHLVR